MSGDPLAPVLLALAGTASAMDWSMAEVSRQVEQNRQPVAPEIVRRAVAEAVRFTVSDVVRAFNLRTIVAAAAVVILLMTGSFGARYLVHGDRLMIASLCHAATGNASCTSLAKSNGARAIALSISRAIRC
jgi:hypothetical protein